MKRLAMACYLMTAFALTTGCTESPPPTASTSTQTDGHGHDHKGGDAHEHTDGKGHAPDVEHSHVSGPHGGTLSDWGGGAFHVEFTVVHEKKEAIVYIVGSDAKSAQPIKAGKIQLVIDDPMTEMELVAKPLDGEAEGTSSRFVGTHDTIGIVREFSGVLSGEIDGTPYSGDFKEEPHGVDHAH